jgi:PadR family transcriptional regulator, regulatory protein PadR
MTNDILEELLLAWEETYKKGQLTLWILLSLKDGDKYADDIIHFISESSNATMKCEEQSLYRILRKFEHLGMVSTYSGKGNKGPDRKYHQLTPMGKELLKKFIDRNIKLLNHESITKLFD